MCIIRRIEAEDMFSVIGIASRNLSEFYSTQVFLSLYEQYADTFYIAETTTHKIVGFIVATLQDNKARIVMLAVEKTHRKKGIGSQLIKQLLSCPTLQHCKETYLEVKPDNHRAIQLYEKFGFTQQELIKNMYHDGSDAVLMSKKPLS